jgi:hypothetical protein
MKSFIVVAVVAWLSAGVAYAQDRPFEEPAGDLPPGEIQRLFDAYAIVQAQEMLNLTDAQYPQFVTRLKALQQTRRHNQQGRNQILQALLRLTRQDSTPDDGLIREQLKTLADHDAQAAGELRKAYEGVDQILGLRQQALFRLFEERMERRKFEFLMRARQNRARVPSRPKRGPSPQP